MFKFPRVLAAVRPLYAHRTPQTPHAPRAEPTPTPAPQHNRDAAASTWARCAARTGDCDRGHPSRTDHGHGQADDKMYEPVSNTVSKFSDGESSKDLKNQDNRTILENPEKPPRRNKPKQQQPRKPDRAVNETVVTDNCHGDARSHPAPDTHRVDLEDVNRLSLDTDRNYKNRCRSVGVQACPPPPYRLRAWPRSHPSKADPEKCGCGRERAERCCTAATRWLFSQCGLAVVLFGWALLGAAAFHETEGPREREQAEELSTLQYNLAVSLALELRQVVPHEPVWLSMVQNYFAKHEALLLNAVSSGYGEGGGGGHIWTYPGCVLFAVSLLTTLGFGAPVPRTTLGRGAAVLFSAVGIPLHFLLILNVGVLAATRLQALAARRGPGQPGWLKWFPVAAIAAYYLLGVTLFGFARRRDLPDSLLFPLDFTATGGVAKTSGHVRVLYALYLELAVVLAASSVSLLQASAARGVTRLGLRLGLLTNT